MAVEFHDPDDECAPFPHRVITGVIRGTAKSPLVICAECDHWIFRVVPDCNCSQRCHALGNMLASLADPE